MAQFFINRPIFAWVIAIIIMLGGALSIVTLPLEQYPDIAPPRVTIGSQYTGASAETVETRSRRSSSSSSRASTTCST